MASTVTRSQSDRAPLGCDGTGDSHQGCAAANLQQLRDAIMSVMDQNLGGNVTNTLLNLCHEELGSSEGKSVSNPILARCT